jgi:LacI family transcriptional regulator
MKKKISIHDIARQINVSAATVSYVLNGKAAEKRISKGMERKVLDCARQLSYNPHKTIRHQRNGQSRTIGMLVENITDPFFAGVAATVERLTGEHGYRLFFASTGNDPAVARSLISAFRDARVDGFIMAPPPGIESDVRALMEEGLPVVLFDRYFPGLPTCNVVVDNFDAALQSMQHFLLSGYRHIGLVTLSSTQTQLRDRLNGYTSAMYDNGLTPCVLRVPSDTGTTPLNASGYIQRFLREHPQLQAVLFACNSLVTAGLDAISQLQLKIPADIAVIGFDDESSFRLFTPAVTALAQPVTEMAEQVVQQLMTCLKGSAISPPASTTVLRTQLIIRQSCMPRA